MQGTPVQPEQRLMLKPLCTIKLFPFSALLIATVTTGILSAYVVVDYCECLLEEKDGKDPTVQLSSIDNVCPRFHELVGVLRGLLVCHSIELAAFGLLYAYFLCSCLPVPSKPLLARGTRWRWTCQCCCTCTSILTCCLFGGAGTLVADFADISRALEDLFDDGGHLDVTLSDILSGIILVWKEQCLKREECRRGVIAQEIVRAETADQTIEDASRMALRRPQMRRDHQGEQAYFQTTERMILDKKHPEDYRAIKEGAHFMQLAHAIYGYLMFVVNRTCTAPCYLTAHSLLCKTAACGTHHSAGDTLCGCNQIAFLKVADLDPDDVVYATFRSGLVERPYCVVVDRAYKAIVVVVRGTFALEDAVADLTLRPAAMDEKCTRFGFDGSGEYCHSGMYASAEWVFVDLERQGTLNDLLDGSQCRFPDYRLYVVGHSLGAGVAAVLGVMLRQCYPTLKVLCFEPPGCVMTKKLAEQDYITSYVLAFDIVPRLSRTSLEYLRDDVLAMISRTAVPKYRILGPAVESSRDVGSTSLFHSRDSCPDSVFRTQLAEFNAYQRTLKAEAGEEGIVLCIPGRRILHLVRTQQNDSILSNFSANLSPKHTPVWASSDDFKEIQVAKSLLADHDPLTVSTELQLLANAFEVDEQALTPC